MATRHHIVLIPGFFGFGNLGDLKYFIGVQEKLEQLFAELELEVEVRQVRTLPTASIRHRAARVLDTLAEIACVDDAPIHLIGHSTGGLDARLAIAPTASLPTQNKFDALDRVRSLVTLSCPHYGTPLATFFSSAAGKPLLRFAAAITIFALRRASLPLSAGLRFGHLLTKLDDVIGLKHTILDQLYDQLLAEFTPDRRLAIIEYLDGVSSDQSLLFQLTAAGVDILNACTADPIGVRYGSVVTAARPPSVMSVLAYRQDFYAQAMHALFVALYTVSSGGSESVLPEPLPEYQATLQAAFGEVPPCSANDGIVPAWSQLWGELIHATRADHLDVVGHFGQAHPTAIHADWLPSRSGFDQAAFHAVWRDVALFITEEARRSERGERAAAPPEHQRGLIPLE